VTTSSSTRFGGGLNVYGDVRDSAEGTSEMLAGMSLDLASLASAGACPGSAACGRSESNHAAPGEAVRTAQARDAVRCCGGHLAQNR
jgi:hypothetical protein